MRFKLKTDEFFKRCREKKWLTFAAQAKGIGVSRQTIRRVSLPETHKDYVSPGVKFVTKSCEAFDCKIDDLFSVL
jgi:DNA-binding XRE family transcriptional regulator